MLYRVIQTKLLQEPLFAHCGGGVGPLMANAILNFHFDFLTPSLRRTSTEDSLSRRVRDIGDVGHGIRDIRDLRWRHNTRDNFINLIPQAACLAGNRFEKENLIRRALSKYLWISVGCWTFEVRCRIDQVLANTLPVLILLVVILHF